MNKIPVLLRMTSPLGEGFEIPYHDFGPKTAPIRIGVIAEAQAVAGSSIPSAAQLAADEINAKGGLTAAAIAAEAGMDDFLAQATPETKLKLIRDMQTGGRLVAMTGDANSG